MPDASEHEARLREWVRPEAAPWRHSPDTTAIAWALGEIENLYSLRKAVASEEQEIQQTLGKALGYPWFRDDQENFPGATDADGVCVGGHVAASLASEAAAEIDRLRAENDRLRPLMTLVVRFAGGDAGAAAELTDRLTGDPDIRDALSLLQATAAERARHHARDLGLEPFVVSANVRNLNA